MKTLIVEDDFTSRLFLQKMLAPFGETHVAVNGREAIAAFVASFETQEPYDLICLDIMMPEMDGQTALKEIRRLEEERGVLVGLGAKIIMTTALRDKENIMTSFRELCAGYLVKPYSKEKLLEFLRAFGFIQIPAGGGSAGTA